MTDAEVSSQDDSIPKIRMSFSFFIVVNKKPVCSLNLITDWCISVYLYYFALKLERQKYQKITQNRITNSGHDFNPAHFFLPHSSESGGADLSDQKTGGIFIG